LAADHQIDWSKIDVAKLPPPAAKKDLTYAKDIRPLLEASCMRCHGQDRPKAHLQLDSREGVLRGGEDGKVVVPGDSKKSLLVIAAAQIDEDTAMPPKRGPGGHGPGGRGPGGPGGPPGSFGGPGQPPPGGPAGGPPPSGPGGPGGGPGGRGFGPPPKPLTAEQVSVLRAWVDQGAK
jgi:cytochrome c